MEQMLTIGVIWLVIIVAPLIILLESGVIRNKRVEDYIGFILVIAFSLMIVTIGIGAIVVACVGLLAIPKSVTFGVACLVISPMILYAAYILFSTFIMPAFAEVLTNKQKGQVC